MKKFSLLQKKQRKELPEIFLEFQGDVYNEGILDVPINKRKIGILGICEGAGSSFVTLCLAKTLAETKKYLPAVVEIQPDNLYDSLGMDKRFSGREYFPFFSTLSQGKSIKGKKNMDEGINWAVAGPAEYGVAFDVCEQLLLINHIYGNIVLCDCSWKKGDGNDGESIRKLQSLLQDMDDIIVVIDPMPSKMLKTFNLLKVLKNMEETGRQMIYVVNKFNSGVYKREMLTFLKIQKPVYMPLMATEDFYKAEYGCKNPYDISTIRKKAEPAVRELFHRLNTQL